jgi:hypothetical protein
MKHEFRKYPNVYRSQEGIKSTMPTGMAFMFLAILVLVVLYAMVYRGGSGVVEGTRFGALIGVFAVGCSDVNLQIGIRLTVQQGIAYFVEWVIVGLVIGIIYRPAY